MSYKRGLAVVIGSVVAVLVSWAATWPRFHPAQTGAGVAASTAASVPSVATALVTVLPPLPGHDDPLAWSHLTPAQQAALAPFAPEWDRFSTERRVKWLRIAARYPKLSPDAQKRLQARMTEWIRMTPEQRRVARENYQVSKELPPQARQRAWKDYQQLPPEQKARLAATERKRRTVVSAPPTSGKSEVHEIGRLVTERARREHRPAVRGPVAAGAASAAVASGAPAASAPVRASGAVAARAAAAAGGMASGPAARAGASSPAAPAAGNRSADVFKGS